MLRDIKNCWPHRIALKPTNFIFFALLCLVILFSISIPDTTHAQTPPDEPCSFQGRIQVSEGIQWKCQYYPDGHSEWVKSTPSEGGGWFDFSGAILSAVAWLAVAILRLASILLYFAGIAFNLSVQLSVLNMAWLTDNLGGIDVGWRVFRDLSNIFFIFVLIYIAVSTILSLSSQASKKVLTKIILIAVLINFSLFFTKVIIDVSNVVALQFYNKIPGSAATYEGTNDFDAASIWEVGISGQVMKIIELQTIFKTEGLDSAAPGESAQSSRPQSSIEDKGTVILTALLGTVFVIITSFVFFAGAILLIIRVALLIFLLITSPIAYVGSLVPKAEGISRDWWKKLSEQCIWVPVYMMMLWVTFTIFSDGGLLKVLSGPNNLAANADYSFSELATEGRKSFFIVINYVIVMVFMLASLIIAKKAGAAGSGFAMSMAGKVSFGAAAFVGRQTGGRVSRLLESNKYTRKLADSNNRVLRTLGQSAKLAGHYGATSSFDLRGLPGAKAIGGTGITLGDASGKGGIKADTKAFLEWKKKIKNISQGDVKETEEKLGLDKLTDAEKTKIQSQKTVVEAERSNLEVLYRNPTSTEAQIKAQKKKIKDEEKLLRDIKNDKRDKFIASNDPSSVISRGGIASAQQIVAAKLKLKNTDDDIKDKTAEIKDKEKEIRVIETDVSKGSGRVMTTSEKTTIANFVKEINDLKIDVDKLKSEKDTYSKLIADEKK